MTVLKKIIKFFLVGFFFFIVVANLTKFKLIAAGDNSWFIDPLFLDRQFVWNQLNLGYFHQIADVIPLAAFYKLFQLLGLPNNIIQTLYYTFFYFGSYISFYFAFRALLPKSDKFAIATAGLLYVFNPFIVISPFHDRLFPVLIFLPLLFLFYYRLLHERDIKYAILLALLSICFSGSNINLPVVSIIFVIFIAYFFYFLFTERLEKSQYKQVFVQQFLLVVFYVLTNLWHFVVDIPSLLAVSDTGAKINQFRAVDTGYFFDHLRLIGQWAWYQFHYLYQYFPFNSQYYKLPLAVTTYLITLLGLSVIICLFSRKFQSRERKIYYFFLLIFLFGALLANGTKGHLGLIFNAIYNSNEILWMFREPWAKFTPVMVFALPVLISGSLSFIAYKLKKSKFYFLLLGLTSLIIMLNSYPLLNGSAIWDKWNGTMRDNRVEVPAYWREMAETVNTNLAGDERITIFPYNFIYMAFNWPHGYFTSINPAQLLLVNPIIVSNSLPFFYSDFLCNETFNKLADPNFNLQKYLGVLNSRYILQENDADWRYSGRRMLPPSESNKAIVQGGFQPVAKTADFDVNYLKQLPNDEPNPLLHDQLLKELTGQPGLILYRAKNDDYFLPRIYSPNKIHKSERDFTDLADIVSDPNYDMRSVIYFSKQNSSKVDLINNLPDLPESSAEIEFKKVNPTKYNLVARKVSGQFVLVFNESYDKNWQIYSSKTSDQQATDSKVQAFFGSKENNQLSNGNFWENWFKKPTVGEENHFVANGYANGWIIDTNSACHDQCQKNSDGTFDLEFSIEFSRQKNYYLGILVSSVTSIILIGYLVFIYRRKKGNGQE